MRIDFTKMHGLGNDFMVFDAPPGGIPSPEQFRRLADRHTGVGFDQALVLEPPHRTGTTLYYRIFNADGIEVEQCGNGVRCVAALLARRGRAVPGDPLLLDSAAGVVRAELRPQGLVTVDMGVPTFDPRALPFDAPTDALVHRLEVSGGETEIGVVSLGNPHAVLLVDSVERAPLESLGRAIESHRRFPKRVNVGFLEILDRGAIRLRVYERGAGETLACGTGACAAVVVARRRGLLDEEVRVQVRGGELRVNWEGVGLPVWLTGPAAVSFEGRVEL
ncbi:MAG TPA: diaminopimelate epimerase [Steroidobacteraceae bacterium]|nr:diaminopimelate epimerase [Steroidobacteraceae bacterium]